jgi:hypothetical protein
MLNRRNRPVPAATSGRAPAEPAPRLARPDTAAYHHRMITTQLDEFLHGHAEAMGPHGAERLAAMWGMPGTVPTDDSAGSLDSGAPGGSALAGAPVLPRGLAWADHTLLEQADLTERITRVRVRWHFAGTDGELLTDSDDDQQKLAALARRLASAPAGGTAAPIGSQFRQGCRRARGSRTVARPSYMKVFDWRSCARERFRLRPPSPPGPGRR